MAVALLGYFTTMVTALVGFMMLLNAVLSSGYLQQVHPRRPYPMPAIAEAAVPDRQPANSTASVEAPKPPAAGKSKHVKVAARDQKRKQGFAARQQENREYVMGPRYAQGGQDGQGGMGMRYAQGGAWQPEGMFGQFGTGRF